MNSDKARELAQMYVDGWRANDAEKIIGPLSEDCVIIESHGPTYRGLADVKEWVESWIKENYKVDKWDIISFWFVDDTAVFEWQFTFSAENAAPRNIDGVTIMKFKDEKIIYLREYRTTEPLYDWGKDKKLDTY